MSEHFDPRSSLEGLGRILGHYRILRQIARGGQATVYLAEDMRLPREVALKVLDPGPATDPRAFERFRREAQITSKLEHPGICTVYEIGEDGGAHWIAMRYVEGESLGRKIATAKSGPPPEDRIVVEMGEQAEAPAAPVQTADESSTVPTTWTGIDRILLFFEQVARTIHVAHEHGVIHRDIKPGNIMVTREDEPVILDFGLAQQVEGEDVTLTRSGEMTGTPAYMSPEQIVGHRIHADRRTDVYSLGVSLYESLTLKRPFNAPTREGLYHAILAKDAPDPRQFNPAVPADLKVVLEAAMEKDRDRRYQSALDLAEDIRRVRAHEPILAKPVGRVLRLRRWSQRNRALATALVGLFIVLTTGLIVALVLLGKVLAADRDKQRALDDKEEALRGVTTERNEKQSALDAKETALANYDRLGDLSRLQKLVAEANTLWPAEPSKAAPMEAWINHAFDLEKRLDSHREARDRLRASGRVLPYTEADRAADFDARAPEREQIGKLRANRARIAADRLAVESRGEDVGGATSRSTLARIDAEIERLEAQSRERLTYRFEAASDQFRHDTIAKLVSELTAFLDPDPRKGLLAQIRKRHRSAVTLERETLLDHEAQWKDAVRSIADPGECPKYRGLRITPQLGLIPIGKDPASGLWEFAHLQTAASGAPAVPGRDPSGRLEVTQGMGLVFVLIPGGTYRMGAAKPDEDQLPSDPNIDPESMPTESPIHEIRLDPFFLSKYEMTQVQWLRTVGRNPSGYPAGASTGASTVSVLHPVEQVSANDCDLWMARLGLAVPTEAQWEYAARAGTTGPRWRAREDGLERAANLADAYMRANGGPPGVQYEAWNDGYLVHAPVGSFDANPFGLHDVLGNVWEWCRDWFESYHQPVAPGDALRSPSTARNRVFRGAGFMNDASLARSALRIHYPPAFNNDDLGLRPARKCDAE